MLKIKLQIKIKDEHNPKQAVLRDGEGPGVLFTEIISIPSIDPEYMTVAQKENLREEVKKFTDKYIETSYEEIKEEKIDQNHKNWDKK